MSEWLKLNHPLMRSPKVRKLAKFLGSSRLEAFGLMVKWLMFIDEQTTDGATGAEEEDVNDEIGHPRAVAGLIFIGWVELDASGCVRAVDFGKHCGETAKARAMNARRKSNQRERDRWHKRNSGPVTEESQNPVTEESQNPVTEESQNPVTKKRDQKRIEKNRIINSSDEEFINAPKTRARTRDVPESPDEIAHYMKNQPNCMLPADEANLCAASFFDEMEACGWVNSKGVPVVDWQPLARSYMRKWQQPRAGGRCYKAPPPVKKRSDMKIDYTETPEY